MKRKYICPISEQVNLVAEKMIATSLGLNEGSADQWTNEKRGGWNCDEWSDANEEKF